MARYIDADALKERLKIISVVADDLYGMGINRGLDRADTEIDMLPTADVVEVKHGKWVHHESTAGGINDTYRCSACDNIIRWITKYCPNCGARMDGGKE